MDKQEYSVFRGYEPSSGRRNIFKSLHNDRFLWVIILVTLALFVNLFHLSPHRPDRHHEGDNFLLTQEEIEYGVVQCASNLERPVVDYTLPAHRLEVEATTSKKILLKNATLIDGDGRTSREINIVIRGTVIETVLPHGDTNTNSVDEEIDLEGRYVTPGLVDSHSHVGVREIPQLWGSEDVTEIEAPITPWGRAIDGFKTSDHGILILASGGITTSLVLTGAKNLISGEGMVIKHRLTEQVPDMVLNTSSTYGGKGQRYLKMACGENTKHEFEGKPGGPNTRQGESWYVRQAYENARQVKQQQDAWCIQASQAKHLLRTPYPRSLEWQSLVDVLRGDVQVHVHCYETEDVYSQYDHADEFGYNITAVHHGMESHLLLDLLKTRGTAVATFSDEWGFKKENYRGSSYIPKLVAEAGIPMSITSDHPAKHGKWLAYEAQIAHHHGLNESMAIASITGVPARFMGIDNRVGYVRPGYDADIVVWAKHPLAVGAVPLQVFLDGESIVTASDKLWEESAKHAYDPAPGIRQQKKVNQAKCKPGMRDVLIRGISKDFISSEDSRGSMAVQNATAVIKDGRLYCVGDAECENYADNAASDGWPVIDVKDGYLLPGLMEVTKRLGLSEITTEPTATDGINHGHDLSTPVYTKDGLKFDGLHLERASRVGVTRLTTPPLSDGFLHGISATFRTGAKSVLDPNAVVKADTALHFTIGNEAKDSTYPSISSQIGTLRNLLTAGSPTHPVYSLAANGSLPIVVHTGNKDVIAHLIALKASTGANIVIMGGEEAHLLAPALADAGIPVILAPWIGVPFMWENRHTLDGPPLTDKWAPQVLIDEGVLVAIGSWDVRDRYVPNALWEASWLAGPEKPRLAVNLVSRNVEEIMGVPASNDVLIYEGNPLEFGANVAVLVENGVVSRCFPEPFEPVHTYH